MGMGELDQIMMRERSKRPIIEIDTVTETRRERDKSQRAPHLVNGPFPHFYSNKHLPVSSLNLRKNTNASGKWISSYTFLMGSFKSSEEKMASEIAPNCVQNPVFQERHLNWDIYMI